MTTALTNAAEVARAVDGSDVNTWGTPTNNCIDLFDRMLGARSTIDVTSADVTLSATEAQSHHINVIGTPVADRNLVFPVKHRRYFVRNSSGRTLSMHVTGFSSNKLYIPAGLGMLVIITTAGDSWGCAPPTRQAGGHPGTLQHPLALTGGSTLYAGPGMFFEGVLVGLGTPSASVMSVFLRDGGASIQFNGANTAASPLIGFGKSDFASYTSGFFRSTDDIGWSKLGVLGGLLGAGIAVGSPTGGTKGTGTINSAAAIYRNGTALPFQTQYAQAGITPTAAAGSSFTHLLTSTPDVIGRLRATVANNGYAVGNTIPAPPQCGLGASATQVWYRIAATGVPILDKSTGAAVTITASQWALDFTAYC